MSNTKKLIELESILGREKTRHILDILINSELKTEQYAVVGIIDSEISETFNISEKNLKNPVTSSEKEIKALFCFLVSEFMHVSNKHIAKAERISLRQLYRYKDKIRDYLTTPETSYYYKANMDFIDKSKKVIENIKMKINEKSWQKATTHKM